jgi:retron-type reverse transcriptase
MKRIGNLYDKICSIENLEFADKKARKGKRLSLGVIRHDLNRESNIKKLNYLLKNKMFKTSKYHIFTITDPKEREIYQLPYYPDRIVHHAVMNILEPIWMSVFTRDTYSCIKNRGVHGVVRKIKEDIKNTEGTQFCLKLDIKKYYPSIDHDILKSILRRKIKDSNLLYLLDGIIDSAKGVPIGNYLSQYFANLYLAYFDHWIKEDKKVKFYYRYADDMVVLSDNKEELHSILNDITLYLKGNLNLTVKNNYQIFPVDKRGIDFVGYRFFHTHILLRKSIKKQFARAVKKSGMLSKKVQSAYWGWAKHCNSVNLLRKLAA